MPSDLTKRDVARRQLGAALALFLDDQDSVSVHSLACSGGEIAERLAEQSGLEPFRSHIIATFPDLSAEAIGRIRNQFWNAFKHAKKSNGRDRNDDSLLERFSDSQNEHALFLGWHDYARAGNPLPIEAQTFEAWYFAKHPEKLDSDVNADALMRLFPGVTSDTRSEQKRRLRRAIERYRRNPTIMANALTDRRRLLLPAI